jgi:hypothetical protein
MLVYLAFGKRRNTHPEPKRDCLQHAAGFNELTRVEMVSPHADNVSTELQALSDANLVKLREGAEYLWSLALMENRTGNKEIFGRSCHWYFTGDVTAARCRYGKTWRLGLALAHDSGFILKAWALTDGAQFIHVRQSNDLLRCHPVPL